MLTNHMPRLIFTPAIKRTPANRLYLYASSLRELNPETVRRKGDNPDAKRGKIKHPAVRRLNHHHAHLVIPEHFINKEFSTTRGLWELWEQIEGYCMREGVTVPTPMGYHAEWYAHAEINDDAHGCVDPGWPVLLTLSGDHDMAGTSNAPLFSAPVPWEQCHSVEGLLALASKLVREGARDDAEASQADNILWCGYRKEVGEQPHKERLQAVRRQYDQLDRLARIHPARLEPMREAFKLSLEGGHLSMKFGRYAFKREPIAGIAGAWMCSLILGTTSRQMLFDGGHADELQAMVQLLTAKGVKCALMPGYVALPRLGVRLTRIAQAAALAGV